MTKNLEIKEKRFYRTIKLKSEELFNRADGWLFARTSTYQTTNTGLAQYKLPGVIIRSSLKSKNIYFVSQNIDTINFLEKRLKEDIN